MDRINFTGSFLIRQPSERLLEKFIKNAMPPSKRTIVPDVYKKGNILVTVRDCYDREVAEYLLEKPFNFTYYPYANTKKHFDTTNPIDAETKLKKEKVVLTKRAEIREYISKLEYSKKPVTYKWHPDDHIPQTLKALKLKAEECIISTQHNITTIHKKEDGRLIAKVSPNNTNGDNFAFIYPRFSQDPVRYATINYKGEITNITSDITTLKEFKKEFHRAKKTDEGRLRPTKKS